MISIDIDADLNLIDDENRNVARAPDRHGLQPGDVAVAGLPGFWSWVLIDKVTNDSIYFHQISGRGAATHGDLTTPA